MMRRGAGLNADQARRLLLKECQYIAPLKLTTDNDIALRIDAVNLKNRLRDVETDGRNLSHDLAPPNRGALAAPTSMALTCRWRSRPHMALSCRDGERVSRQLSGVKRTS